MKTYTPKRALFIGDKAVSVAVPAEVQDALERWAQKHTDELIEVLAPFGLHPYDLAAPQYRRVVTVD